MTKAEVVASVGETDQIDTGDGRETWTFGRVCYVPAMDLLVYGKPWTTITFDGDRVIDVN